MPLLSRLQAFSFNTESWFSTSSFIFVKNLLLLINFLSLLAGLILVGAGGYINTNSAEDIVGLSESIAVASIVIGCIVAIISFLGCFGAANEKGVLLKTYFALLLILVILEISIGAAAYAKRDEVSNSLDVAWHSSFSSGRNTTIAGIEKLLNCCGFSNVTDAAVSPICHPPSNITVSCSQQLTATLKGSLSTIGAAGLALGIVELVGLIFSVVLFRKIASKENAQSTLLNEAWRINRTKVQYGYQNYQYV
ncbi:hypothetical protein BASA61_004660 [Batrachochytrium salamandrivorans]|nr:hypothetical protein BASA62_004688 [Batrachochytrium salamandrivorans]KAH6570955.1 hypothetical protein BASA60_007384 [Batrachochytrium salamandrivorans]KAH6592337.1 hypothetical protein BASA61_004660 [Batrachochytrium salamandrivorans]KAH9252653.1 hypothetical protein BASA81_009434 [Batrachochytrium salamandrivorans]KAH9270151.1 hypothetical protein BASA83_007827 [Batrachochytrium salamandrivorans]